MKRTLLCERLEQRLLLSRSPELFLSGDSEPEIYLVRLGEPPSVDLAQSELGAPETGALTNGAAGTNSAGRWVTHGTGDESRAVFLSKLEQKLSTPIDVVQEYRAAFSGFALRLTEEQAALVSQFEEVTSLEVDRLLHVATDTSPDLIGATNIWNGTGIGTLPATSGEGIVIGIIDTGINPQNPSFAQVGPVDGYVHQNPLGSGNYLGTCAQGDPQNFGCNDKLIGAYDFTGSGPLDDDGHGSHTAGIAAGNLVSADITISGSTIPNQEIAGIAPHANIISYDACVGQSCSVSATVAAIDQAILDGVDVLNMSIGIDGNDPWSNANSEALLSARNAGIIVVAAAGNDGPTPETIDNPANAPWVMSVGSTSHGRTFHLTLDVTGPGDIPAELVGLAAQPGTGPDLNGNLGPAEILFSGDVSAGNELGCSAYPANAFQNKLALIQRGTCFFSEKVGLAADAGAIGAIVFNHLAGGLVTMAALEETTIPAVFLAKDDGEVLRQYIKTHPDALVRINELTSQAIIPGLDDLVAATSGRGPNPLVDVISPSVTAPGVNVLAPTGVNGAVSWGLMSGTSMASPHVAGAAALLKSLHPTWSAGQIQSALMTTAVSDGILKEDGQSPANPFDRGSGRIDVQQAALAGLLLDESYLNFVLANPDFDGDASTLNLPSFATTDLDSTFQWERTVSSSLPTEVHWAVTTTANPGLTLNVTPSTILLPGGDSTTMRVDATVGGISPGESLFGEIILTPNQAGVPTARFPVAVIAGQNPPAPPVVTGDYNANGTVGSEDYTLWQDQRGNIVTPFSGADGNGNGIVDDADYQVWKDNFGATSGSASTLNHTLTEQPPAIMTPQATTNVAPTILKIRSIVVRQTGLPPETTDFALGSDSRNWRLEHQGPSGKQLANSVQTGPAYLTASRILAGLRPMASDRSTSPNAVSKDAFFGTIGTSSQTFPAIKGLDALAVNLSDHVERDLSEKP